MSSTKRTTTTKGLVYSRDVEVFHYYKAKRLVDYVDAFDYYHDNETFEEKDIEVEKENKKILKKNREFEAKCRTKTINAERSMKERINTQF
uniref:Uncharacterized protein n=1 Tax=Solanum lycopersicum TaxID=4081 RepID=A0A3Q7IA24_SOLLC